VPALFSSGGNSARTPPARRPRRVALAAEPTGRVAPAVVSTAEKSSRQTWFANTIPKNLTEP
jgi:hypothetical protein